MGKVLDRQKKRGMTAGGGGPVVVGAADVSGPGVGGRETSAFGQDPGTQYKMRWRAVPIDELVPSNLDNGSINPDYDPSLQPRDRTRAASQRQIDQTAKNFIPEAALVDFRQLDKGAPIVGDDMAVESGNGRVLAMRRMKENYPAKWAEYQATMREYAAEQGIDPDSLPDDAVLVRERLTKVDRAEFAREANQSAVLRMSTQEVAMQDRRLISSDSMQNFEVKEGQSVDQALRAAGNREFVRRFTGQLPETERGAIMRRDGSLNREGIWRIKAAMTARVFPGEAGARLGEVFTESLDSNVKNFETGLGGAMPALLRAEGQFSSGQRDSGLNMADDFSKSMDMLSRLRESGISTKDYMAQGSLFQRETTPTQDKLIAHFDSIGRSSKKIREFFAGYSDLVDRADDPRQMGLFGGGGGGPKSKDDLIDRLIKQQG